MTSQNCIFFLLLEIIITWSNVNQSLFGLCCMKYIKFLIIIKVFNVHASKGSNMKLDPSEISD